MRYMTLRQSRKSTTLNRCKNPPRSVSKVENPTKLKEFDVLHVQTKAGGPLTVPWKRHPKPTLGRLSWKQVPTSSGIRLPFTLSGDVLGKIKWETGTPGRLLGFYGSLIPACEGFDPPSPVSPIYIKLPQCYSSYCGWHRPDPTRRTTKITSNS